MKEIPSEKPIPRMAYIFNSLKHVDEVNFYRNVYGKNFVLISLFSNHKERLENLSKEIAESQGMIHYDKFRSDAEGLLQLDEKEQEKKLGQEVKDTFSMSDFFLNGA